MEDQDIYEPLTRSEVVSLLNDAIAIKDHQNTRPRAASEISGIQVRLGRAIPGMTSPHPIEGPVSDALNELDHAYVAWITNPTTLFLKEFEKLENAAITNTICRILGIE